MPDKQQIIDFMATDFPQCNSTIDEVGGQSARVRHKIGGQELRPGGTVSGPVMMAVADVALYVAILGEIGIVPLAVTTNLNINFLRKPAADRDIIGECTLIKVGRSLIVGDVNLYSEGDSRPVAHAVGTYSVPPVNS